MVSKSQIQYILTVHHHKTQKQMSLVTRQPPFCKCENKGADQQCGNRTADQRLCFRFIDSTIPLPTKSIFKPLAVFCGCTAWFVSNLVGNPEDRFSRDVAQWLLEVTLCHYLFATNFFDRNLHLYALIVQSLYSFSNHSPVTTLIEDSTSKRTTNILSQTYNATLFFVRLFLCQCACAKQIVPFNQQFI